ncbi:MAG: response regulator [Hyphomicrobium sp.]|nr:MAG: response regulator [Hyphomicrobium sp.]
MSSVRSRSPAPLSCPKCPNGALARPARHARCRAEQLQPGVDVLLGRQPAPDAVEAVAVERHLDQRRRHPDRRRDVLARLPDALQQPPALSQALAGQIEYRLVPAVGPSERRGPVVEGRTIEQPPAFRRRVRLEHERREAVPRRVPHRIRHQHKEEFRDQRPALAAEIADDEAGRAVVDAIRHRGALVVVRMRAQQDLRPGNDLLGAPGADPAVIGGIEAIVLEREDVPFHLPTWRRFPRLAQVMHKQKVRRCPTGHTPGADGRSHELQRRLAAGQRISAGARPGGALQRNGNHPPLVVHPMSRPSTSAASVLVVEDEPLVRDYVSDILGQSGFDVVEAATGEEALSRLAEGGVCAVVSDVAMPGRLNGFELARRVREESPRTGVVLVSGVLEPSKAHLPGGVRFLTKPVKASTLLRLVREVADPRARLPAAAPKLVP